MLPEDLLKLPPTYAARAFWSAPTLPRRNCDTYVEASRHWAEEVTAAWGSCGYLALEQDEPVGYLTVAPGHLVPQIRSFPTIPVSPEAAVLMSVRVAEQRVGQGMGRRLVQAAAAWAARSRVEALEAVGVHGEDPCLPPAAWLERVGFRTVRAHPLYPRLRMDISSTVRWRPELGAAWHRLTDLVSQPVPPEPAGFDPAPYESTRR